MRYEERPAAIFIAPRLDNVWIKTEIRPSESSSATWEEEEMSNEPQAASTRAKQESR